MPLCHCHKCPPAFVRCPNIRVKKLINMLQNFFVLRAKTQRFKRSICVKNSADLILGASFINDDTIVAIALVQPRSVTIF